MGQKEKEACEEDGVHGILNRYLLFIPMAYPQGTQLR
jgi:hypothetical protein